MPSLTREAIHRVLGPVDDDLAAQLAATGANEQELLEAWTWLNSDEALVNDLRPFPSARTAQIAELLASLQDEEEASRGDPHSG